MKLKYQFFLNIETDEKGRSIGFMDGYVAGHKMDLVDAGEIEVTYTYLDIDVLEALFYRYNQEHPEGYRNRSMSVGDVVVLEPGTENVRAYAVAHFGFDRLPAFNFVVSTL